MLYQLSYSRIASGTHYTVLIGFGKNFLNFFE